MRSLFRGLQSSIRRLFRHPEPPARGDFEIFLGGNWMVHNVLVFTEQINATYFIHFDIALRRLHAKGKVNLAVVSQKHVAKKGAGCWERWADTFRPDVIVMTRYGQPHGAAILDSFRRRRLPVIYHIDDDLLHIPDTLGAEILGRQGAHDVVEARRYLLGNCDMIYASTAFLSTLLGQRFPAQRVFHGLCAPYIGSEIQSTVAPERPYPVVGYMASKGHQRDLELVVPALERLLEERKNLRFELFGTISMPERLQRFGERVASYSVQNSYVDFLRTLSDLRWDVGLAPLLDETFNLCKTPTKYLEYTAAGISTVASDVPVYSQVIPPGGGRLVRDDWCAAIAQLLDSPESRRDALVIARQHCSTIYEVSRIEQQLLNVFKQAKR